jgi:glycosyltransferase involved in cell wall biosynthesis
MYPPQHLGGYELVWQASVRRLRSRGHQARVLTTGFERSPQPEQDEDVHRELRWYWREHAFPRLSLRETVRLERHNWAVLRDHLAELEPAVVCWWAMGGMSLSLIERVRRIGPSSAAVVCDEWLLYGPRVDGWLKIFRGPRRPLAPIATRLTGVPARLRRDLDWPLLFPSRTLMTRAANAGWNTSRARVVHQGVSREDFRPAPRPEWRWRLLYVGRIDPRKGIDTAILALPLLPEEATLRVVGGGDEEHVEELRRLVVRKRLSGRVSFTERPRRQLAEEYASADVLVFPVRWVEPWGLVPLEAMMVGAPVVATGRGGSGEYLRDGENCLVFDAEEGATALARAVRRLAGDGELRSRLREHGFRTTERFGEDDFNLGVEDLLRDAQVSGG